VIETRAAVPEITAGILLRDRLGNDVFGTNTFHLGANRAATAPGTRLAIEFAIPRLNLGLGTYSLTAALHTQDTHVSANFDWWDKALVFQIVPGDRPFAIGLVALDVSAQWVDPATFEPGYPGRPAIAGIAH
jgi:lipopolysaccharide transport system ATP-binding protein